MQHLGRMLSLNGVIHYFSRSLDGILSQPGRLKFPQARINCSNHHRASKKRSFACVRPLSHDFRRSVSDEPILSKFSAQVTISVQPMVLRGLTWKSSGTVGTFTEIIVRQCLVQFLLALVGGVARNL